jgi:hypothetical protein
MFGFLRKKQLTRSEPSAVIDQVVSGYIAPLLKTEGFKKTGRTWIKESADFSYVVNVQASQWNGSETGASFTINYGIYIPSIYESLFGMQKPKAPKEYDCVLRKRVTESTKAEVWWCIYDDTDIEKLGGEVGAIFTDQCFSMFKEIGSLADVVGMMKIDSLEYSPGFFQLARALLYAEIGDRVEARNCFSLAYHASRDYKAFQSKVILAAKKYGIGL